MLVCMIGYLLRITLRLVGTVVPALAVAKVLEARSDAVGADFGPGFAGIGLVLAIALCWAMWDGRTIGLEAALGIWAGVCIAFFVVTTVWLCVDGSIADALGAGGVLAVLIGTCAALGAVGGNIFYRPRA